MNGTGTAVTALLVMRLTGLLWIAPLFSSRAIPGTFRTALTLLLAAALWPAARASASAGIAVTPATLVGESMVGLALGIAAVLLIAAAEGAGDLLASQMGLSGATVLDPSTEAQLPVIGSFLGLLATACLLSVGGHRAMLGAMHASLAAAPLGSDLALDRGALAAAGLGGRLFWLGLRFAAPVVAIMAVTNVALGILSRAAPQLNVLTVAFPLQIGVGLLALGTLLPILFVDAASWPAAFTDLARSLLVAFVPQGAR